MIFDPIRYIALLGPREEPVFPNVPQDYLNAFPMWSLGFFPHSMFHYIYGVEQYSVVKAGSLQLGYDLIFVHPDIASDSISFFPWDDKDTPIVLLLCTDNKETIVSYNTLLSEYIGENVLCVSEKESATYINLPCKIATDETKVWDWFTKYAYSHYIIEDAKLPFSVPLFLKSLIDLGNVFSPSRVNTQTLNSIMGNWSFRREYSKEEIIDKSAASSSKAIKEKDSSDRQEILIEQIRKIRTIEDIQASQFKVLPMLEDQYRAPLVIAAPYTSVDMRRLVDKRKLKGKKAKMAALLGRIMDSDYTKSYTIYRELGNQNNKEGFLSLEMLRSKIVDSRMRFFDNAAMLHCSIRFSPYFRMPILGKNISSELSFVGIKNVDKVALAKGRNHSIREAIEKVGEKMTSTALCPQTVTMLKNDCSQIVAMTDLPIEWMMLDGVPMGFSHDVCRLPESPIQSLLSQYEANKYTPYIIPKDILKRSLVVYGNNDPGFVLMQGAVEMLKERYGFQTCRCLNKKEFFQKVKDANPDFLIVDAHGDVEKDTHQSFIMMGDEKVTGFDIIDSGIHPRLVFLSACNTFPTYNSVSTIANAFFEAGACSVTTSYMPLEIGPATTLYCRLLANLDIAANKMMHRNWLAFMSHLLRTSYIQAPMYKDMERMDSTLSAKLTKLTTGSMLFNNRRRIYSELNTNEFTESMGADYKDIIPHYLMYSTLGRADLIRFQSFIDEVNGEVMPKEEFMIVYQNRQHSSVIPLVPM